MKRKLVILLTAFLIVSTLPLNVYAVQGDFSNSKEIYTDENLNFTLERVIDSGKVTVFVKSPDRSTQHTIINDNGKLYLDGKEINNNLANNLYSKSLNLDTSSSISWGPWQTSYQTIDTGGLSTAVIAAIIAAAAPWVPVRVVAAVASAVAGKYDTLGIKIQIRYGSDDQYYYYERYTDFYGDGEHIYGPFYDTGKEPLE
jgi:hypothetical protein